MSDCDDLEDEIEYVLAATNGIVNGSQLEDADRPTASVVSASSRPSTTATIVHVHSQPPVKIMNPGSVTSYLHRGGDQIVSSVKRTPSSVVFHENPTSYHTIIKVVLPLTAQMVQILISSICRQAGGGWYSRKHIFSTYFVG